MAVLTLPVTLKGVWGFGEATSSTFTVGNCQVEVIFTL